MIKSGFKTTPDPKHIYPIKKALRSWNDLAELGKAFAGKAPTSQLGATQKVAGVANQQLIKGELGEANLADELK